MRMDYTVITQKSYDAAVEAVVEATQRHGFRVLMVHDVAETLAEKGFDREPVSIVEVCNARYASQVLEQDVRIGLMLPCPIMVWEESGKVQIATMLPTLIADFFPRAEIAGVASEVEGIMKAVIDEAAN